MSANTNKRLSVKWVRDRAKAAYEKKDSCHICGSTENLELHHTTSLTLLLDKWARDNNYDISTDEGILEVRDEFISEHRKEIYEEVFTLCLRHHQKLHAVFGKAPPLNTSPKQVRWIERQKAKVLGLVDLLVEDKPNKSPKSGTFSKFY